MKSNYDNFHEILMKFPAQQISKQISNNTTQESKLQKIKIFPENWQMKKNNVV